MVVMSKQNMEVEIMVDGGGSPTAWISSSLAISVSTSVSTSVVTIGSGRFLG